jgi:hypothetical protein
MKKTYRIKTNNQELLIRRQENANRKVVWQILWDLHQPLSWNRLADPRLMMSAGRCFAYTFGIPFQQ